MKISDTEYFSEHYLGADEHYLGPGHMHDHARRHTRLLERDIAGVFINNPMITITIRISSPGLIFNPTIIDYRLDHAAITDYD